MEDGFIQESALVEMVTGFNFKVRKEDIEAIIQGI